MKKVRSPILTLWARGLAKSSWQQAPQQIRRLFVSPLVLSLMVFFLLESKEVYNYLIWLNHQMDKSIYNISKASSIALFTKLSTAWFQAFNSKLDIWILKTIFKLPYRIEKLFHVTLLFAIRMTWCYTMWWIKA